MLIRTISGKVCVFPERIAVCPVCLCGYVAHAVQDYCPECGPLVVKLQGRAAYRVNQAVRKGELPRPETLRCVDCGKRATIYEHRDYGKPLDVVPACMGCNCQRGPAHGFGSLSEQQRRANRPYIS